MVFNIEIERQLEKTSVGPTLCISITIECFLGFFFGKRLNIIPLFIRKVNDGDFISALSFKNLGQIPSKSTDY